MSPDYRREGTSAEQIAGGHEPKRSSLDATEKLDVAYKVTTVTKILVGAIIVVVGTIGSASVWGKTRASTAYVDDAVATEARVNATLHKDTDAKLAAETTAIAELKTEIRGLSKQLDQANAQLAEIRGYIVTAPKPVRP
jgi:uncharacterized protein HemX